MPTSTVPFTIDAWEPAPAAAEGLGRAIVRKTYSGALTGTGVAELVAWGQAAYVALERVEGTLDGRAGTFAIQHCGLAPEGAEPSGFGAVVPGSGTGELAGLSGEVRFEHDEAGARLVLTSP